MRNEGRKTYLEFIVQLVKKFLSHHEKDLCRKQCDTELTHIKQTKFKKDILKKNTTTPMKTMWLEHI